MKLCFIGPGTMGRGMAMNLARKRTTEEDWLIVARREEARRPFAEEGLEVSGNTADAAGCDVIFLCLPDARIVRESIAGAAARLWKRGSVIVDCSTIDHREAAGLAEEFSAEGITYLDCPVSGHRERSLAGTLTLMCGGEKAAYDRVEPLLQRMGTPLYMGTSGSGQLAKMINNCALNICTASFCELMPLGVSMGLDPEQLAQVLMSGSGASNASKTLLPEILEGRFEHGFTMGAAFKDMQSMAQLLEEKKLRLPTFEGTMESYLRALREGYGQLYKGAMMLPYEEQLQVRCRRAKADTSEG